MRTATTVAMVDHLGRRRRRRRRCSLTGLFCASSDEISASGSSSAASTASGVSSVDADRRDGGFDIFRLVLGSIFCLVLFSGFYFFSGFCFCSCGRRFLLGGLRVRGFLLFLHCRGFGKFSLAPQLNGTRTRTGGGSQSFRFFSLRLGFFGQRPYFRSGGGDFVLAHGNRFRISGVLADRATHRSPARERGCS